MPRKAKKKKGGWPIRQPKRPAPPPSSSEEDDEEMVLIRGLINRMEVLKKAKAVPSDKGAGPSGVVVPTKVPCHTCGTARTQLVKSLSNRMEVPEKGGGPAGPVSPTEPVDPGMLMPGGPVPVLPSPGVPLPPLPVDPVPVLPSSVVPLPPLPVDQSALNSAVPLAPGSSWIRYDESFRMWAALDPTLPWDMPLQEFWLVNKFRELAPESALHPEPMPAFLWHLGR
ncbi:serine/threonine-protein kinase WNK4-like isoform X5 [Hemicordylus capensis]|nr:serine/threonine-protein kinase WNK4-like isoform X5 [Hemicordylus capensis]